MRIVFLDRNVISTIKDHLLGNEVETKRLSKLRELDTPNTVISAVFSIMEGQSGKLESIDKMLVTLKEGYKAIGGFFKKAHSDKKYLYKNIDVFLDAFCGEQEESWTKYEMLLKYVKKELYQPMKKANRKFHKEKILSLAKENNIPNGHPVLMCCLALLYGSEDARKIIKPKKICSHETEHIDVYNSLSDLMILSRISNARAAFKRSLGVNSAVLKYLTFDKGLAGFLSKIDLINSTFVGEEITQSTTVYKMELFPYLNEAEYLELHREMGARM